MDFNKIEKEKRFIADLHIHSRFSRACSKELNIENLVKWAKIKGMDILGTGDFTHPEWFKEIKEKLKDNGKGLFVYKDEKTKEEFPFILTGEISLIYSQDGKGRKVHLNLLIPSIEIAEKIHNYLDKKGLRRDYDGRPIFGIPCDVFVRDMKDISEDIEIIPAHIWTPYFGVFGSMSGFNSLKDAFQEEANNIHAIETGISSDPEMNWRIKELTDKNISIVSFSDSHCVHPNTLITLDNGYVLPINEIGKEKRVLCSNFTGFKCVSKNLNQFSKVKSPSYLKKVKYHGGEIVVSDKHRFFVYEDKKAVQKYAHELKEGDSFFRLAKISHKTREIGLKIPNSDYFYILDKEGLLFLKNKRKEKNFLQRDIAKLLGIEKNHYWKIETGKVKINHDFLNKLSEILNFDLDCFLSQYSFKECFNKFPNSISDDLFEFLGYLAGDGCYSVRNRGRCLLLSDKNKDLLNHYKKKIDRLFGCSCRLSKYGYQNSYELFVPAHVAEFIKLNFPEVILKTLDIRIPRKIFSAPLEFISGFLRGFFDAEGCVGHHSIDVCSSNKLLLYQIDGLLKKFGIFTTVSLNNFEKSKCRFRHRLFLYGEKMKIFRDKINFNHLNKREKLDNYLSSIKFPRKSKIKTKGDFILSEITSIEDIPSDSEYLYDLSIKSHKNYIANQVVVHNSFWPWRLGREATIFKKTNSYKEIIRQIRENDFLGTIEVDPAYGKYHWDGHRDCDFYCSPEKTKELNGICPKCGNKLTVGVEYRVEAIAENPKRFRPDSGKMYYSILPLHEVISLYLDKGLNTKSVWNVYNKLIKKFDNEFNILLDVNKRELINKGEINENLVELIMRNREGDIKVKPGFDGEYGKALIGDFFDLKENKKDKQERLF